MARYGGPSRKPPPSTHLYCGVFKNGDYVGSCYLNRDSRDLFRKKGFALTYWNI